jgi:ABC-type bacteriocin/lantibiotic exporter with double-glycine peptidase domain
MATAVLNIPFFLVGIIYLNSLELGWATTGVGFFVLCLFVPLWFYSQRETKKATESKEKRAAERETILAEISA